MDGFCPISTSVRFPYASQSFWTFFGSAAVREPLREHDILPNSARSRTRVGVESAQPLG
jgi:hypothetical protein